MQVCVCVCVHAHTCVFAYMKVRACTVPLYFTCCCTCFSLRPLFDRHRACLCNSFYFSACCTSQKCSHWSFHCHYKSYIFEVLQLLKVHFHWALPVHTSFGDLIWRSAMLERSKSVGFRLFIIVTMCLKVLGDALFVVLYLWVKVGVYMIIIFKTGYERNQSSQNNFCPVGLRKNEFILSETLLTVC